MLKEALTETRFEQKMVNEAFSDKNLEKVSKLLASLANKRIDSGSFFPFLGSWYKDEFVSEGRKGVGYKFLSEKGHMIRFGFINPKTKAKNLKEKFVINRVDYWKPDGTAKFDKPSITVELQPWLNIVEVTGEIFDVLSGKVVESYIPKKLISYAKYKGLTDDEINAYKSGATIKSLLNKKGLWDENEYRGYSIKKNVKETNNTIKDLDNVEKEVKKVKEIDPKVVFEDIEKITKLLALDILKQNGLIISGAPGIGKTYGMEQKLKELFGEFNIPDSKVIYLKGGNVSTFGLYKLLYTNREDKIIVLDDSDALLSDKAIVNMLKSAMDSYPEREISWESNLVLPMTSLSKEDREEYYAKVDAALADPQQASKVGGKIKMPGQFPFRSKIFFISNNPASYWTKNPHLGAIWSRSVHIDVSISKDGVRERILSIIDHIEPDVPREVKINLLEKMYEESNVLNIRVFAAACQMKGASIKGVEDLSEDDAERFATAYLT